MTDNKNATRNEIDTDRRELLSQLSTEEMKRISGGYRLTTETTRGQDSVINYGGTFSGGWDGVAL